jgi:hypothetical protein
MNQPIIIVPGGQGGGYNNNPRPPRRRKNRADKRADSEKEKKKKEAETKKQLRLRIFYAISIFVLPLFGISAAFVLLAVGLGAVKLTEISAYLLRLIVNQSAH